MNRKQQNHVENCLKKKNFWYLLISKLLWGCWEVCCALLCVWMNGKNTALWLLSLLKRVINFFQGFLDSIIMMKRVQIEISEAITNLNFFHSMMIIFLKPREKYREKHWLTTKRAMRKWRSILRRTRRMKKNFCVNPDCSLLLKTSLRGRNKLLWSKKGRIT